MRERPFAIAVLAALLAVSGLTGSADASLRKVALGVSVLDDQNVAALDAETAALGRTPAIWAVWSDWGGSDKDFPTGFMNTLKGRGIVPMVNWQPTAPGSSDCTRWSLDNIIKGHHDAYIRQWAQAAKAYGGRVILRFAHEMNGYWFIWGYGRCENTPAKFRAAWRHVWQIFKGPGGVGATNVKFLWSTIGSQRVKPHFPGNNYVDYLGVSAFNWGPPMRKWGTMVQNLSTAVSAVMRVSKKPIIVGEIGAADVSCAGCDKAAWIRDGYPAVYKKWPKIKAIVYFDIDMRPVANQPNWLLSSPSAALTAYSAVAADPRFQGQLP